MRDSASVVVRAVRSSARAAAVVTSIGGTVDMVVDDADGIATERHLFEIGSLTKPLTALLLAEMVLAGDARLELEIGEVLDAGPCSDITLGQLATHTSGLPRLPGNLLDIAAATPADPYGSYGETDLVAALHTDRRGSAAVEYSNYGYMVLGLALTKLGGMPYDALLRDRVFRRLGMHEATARPEQHPTDRRIQGFDASGAAVPHWSKVIPGAGGVEASLEAMCNFLSAQLRPSETELEVAIEMTQRRFGAELLGWQRIGDVCWHNGATYGFSGFLAFDRQAGTGVVALCNAGGDATTVDAAGFGAMGIRNPLLS